MTGVVRRAAPYSLLPLGVGATLLASSPWLRAFPADVLAIPLVGTAVISVLLPVLVVAIGIRRLWLTALIEVVAFVFFTSLVALHQPAGFVTLWRGLVDGPSQILTYALPLVSPRSLMVAPLALCWISGAVLGECLGRAWRSVMPYAALLVTFGLAYAATTRAITNADDGRRYDTLLAAGLLCVLLLLRAGGAWIAQHDAALAVGRDGAMPVRGLLYGITGAVVVALGMSAVAQTSLFSGTPAAPERVPPIARDNPITPLEFISQLRPQNPRSTGTPVFDVSLDRTSSRFVAIADVDTYDGAGWSFDRRFRPSGGAIPADTDSDTRSTGPIVTQQYRIARGALTGAPWMPFQYRPQEVDGLGVNVDPTSGMVVPTSSLAAGQRYSVQSRPAAVAFDKLPTATYPATSAPPSDTFLPPTVRRSLDSVVTALRNETGTSAGSSPIAFLKAVQADFRTNYALSGGPQRRSAEGTGPSPSATGRGATTNTQRSGSSSFADVLASILGPGRSATPEQYATLTALLGRQLGVPTRVVTGFRLAASRGSSTQPRPTDATVPAGTYPVTTRQAWTWVEVPIQGRGWVVLDAAPNSYSSQLQPSLSARPTPTETPSSTPNAQLTQAPSDAGNAVAPPSATPTSSTSQVALAAVLVGGAAGLVVLVVAALLARKRRRFVIRNRHQDPRRRLVGAWQETLDVLAEFGLPDLSALTSGEVATVAGERFGDDVTRLVRSVGTAADFAIFNPSARVDPGIADDAWQAHNQLRRESAAQLTLPGRFGAALRYHRPRGRPVDDIASWADADRTARATALSGARGRSH